MSSLTSLSLRSAFRLFHKDNYVVVYKRTGEDKNVQKVEKPQITPVEVNRQDRSPFLTEVTEMTSEEIQPVFVDYNNDMLVTSIKNDIPLLYKKNEENELFSLSIVFDIGSYNNKKLPLAAGYFSYLGTSKYSPSQLKEEFYKLGCSYSISTGEDQTALTLSGLNENFDKAFVLLESVITDLKPENAALKNLVSDVLKVRADSKLDKESILWDAMYSYGRYGSRSPYTDILTESELASLNPEELINIIKDLPNYKQKVLYYGPLSSESISSKLNAEYTLTSGTLKEAPVPVKYEELTTTENTVYVVNYPEMVQAEILMMTKKDLYDKEKIPYIALYNEYFGGGMAGIVFQELRESKALAYSTFSSYSIPQRKDRAHYNIAYIGTQSDKLPEAMSGLFGLLNDMPVSEITYNSAKDNLVQKFSTERITKAGVLNSYLSAQKLGLNHDIRKDIYEMAKTITIDDIKKFQAENVKDSKYTIMVLGDKSKLDIETLSKYGNVKYLTLEEIFGY